MKKLSPKRLLNLLMITLLSGVA